MSAQPRSALAARASAPLPRRPKMRYRRRSTAAQVGWTVAASLVAVGLFAQTDSLLVPLGLIVAAGLLTFGLARPALFVSTFLVMRPLLDHYSDKTLGGAGLNLGGLLGLLLIVVTGAFALAGRRLSAPRGMFAFILIMLLTASFGLLAFLKLGSLIGLRPVTEFVRLLALCSIYFLAINLFASVDRARRLIVLVGVSAFVPAIIGLVQWAVGAPVKENVNLARISGTFVGPNPFGTYLAVGAVVLVALPRGYIPQTVRFVCIAVMAAALVGTYSRVGYIVFLGGVLVVGWRVKRAAAAGVVIAAVVIVLTVPTVRDRVLPKNDPSASQSQTYESFTWRLDNWKGLLGQWEKSPIVGFGVGTVPFVNPRVVTLNSQDRFGGGYDAHNLAVKSLVEGGLVLFLGWAFLLASLIGIAARLARNEWPLQQLGRLLMIIWALIAFVSVTTGEPTSESATMFALLAATGALEGAHRSWLRERGADPEAVRAPVADTTGAAAEAPSLVPA